ncbi:MAG: hypothetical protein U0M23_03860 [Acutalibacteraceae bacterium]|nr:hypothetical protein [Acutalibacteraceae bacterium]HIR03157.1 hypothetical protein [Candidatus Scatovicinus merdipullorum]
MENKKKQQKPQPEVTDAANEKTAFNNQWTNNNTKYYPDRRPRRNGPGGEETE